MGLGPHDCIKGLWLEFGEAISWARRLENQQSFKVRISQIVFL